MKRVIRRRYVRTLTGMLAVPLWIAGIGSAATATATQQIAEDGTAHVVDPSAISRSVVHHHAAGAATLDVAIVASAAPLVTDPWFTDPRDRLVASGAFASVTVINAAIDTPTTQELEPFDAVLVWSNLDFADAESLGDNLSRYVDNGGGVVVALFANTGDTPGRFFGGRWETHDYEAIITQGGTTTGPASLGALLVPGHALLGGVVAFNGGTSSFRPTTTDVIPSATVVASWSDGSTLVAVREDTVGGRVDLGFYPPSNVVAPGFWADGTDGDQLLINALVYAGARSPLIHGDSDADDDVDADDFAAFEACRAGVTAVAGCVTFDSDANGTIDCFDWPAFRQAWTAAGDPPDIVECRAVIPAVSEWGAVVLACLILAAGTGACANRRPATV